MREDFVAQIGLKADAGAAVCPAADVDGSGKAGGVARGLFDVHTHHGLGAPEAVGADVELIESLGDDLLEFGAAGVAVV